MVLHSTDITFSKISSRSLLRSLIMAWRRSNSEYKRLMLSSYSWRCFLAASYSVDTALKLDCQLLTSFSLSCTFFCDCCLRESISDNALCHYSVLLLKDPLTRSNSWFSRAILDSYSATRLNNSSLSLVAAVIFCSKLLFLRLISSEVLAQLSLNSLICLLHYSF